MTVFEQGLEAWPMERARAFMEQRRQQALAGPGSICTRGDASPYYPYEAQSYPHQHLLGSLYEGAWLKITEQPPESLIPVDPFEPSLFRPDGLKIWDAAVGIPACSLRPEHTIKTRMIPTLRNTNTLWCQATTLALGRVGPLGPGGEVLRPKGAFIYDLVHDPVGWKMLEGAHALAHRVGETKPREWKKAMFHAGKTYFHTQRFLAQMCVCRAYGLPFDVWCLDEGLKGMPDVTQYGIEIKSSSYFRSPIIKLPTTNGEAARPDQTLAVVSAGVYIEPHPRGFTEQTGLWKEVNRWACSPTVVVIAGWELIDVVTHQVLCSSDPEDGREPVCYGMSPADLQAPDTFWAYLRYAAEHRGMPAVDNKRYWYVDEWLESDDYKNLLSITPPLPCMNCMRLNMRAEGAPQKPQGKMPEPRTADSFRKWKLGDPKYKAANDNEEEWLRWELDMQRVHTIVEDAVEYYEARLYGHVKSAAMRALRKSGYKKRLKDIGQIQSMQNALDRAQRQGRQSEAVRIDAERKAFIAETQRRIGIHQ